MADADYQLSVLSVVIHEGGQSYGGMYLFLYFIP